MKSFAKRIVARAVQNDVIWKLFDQSINRVAQFAGDARESPGAEEALQRAIRSIAPDLVVKHGPFAGLQYTSTQWIGGAVFPKVLGCYERELHEVIEACCRTAYTEVVDIGCAEGYYAVGFARRLPLANVYAYDVKKGGIEICREMAEANGVRERLVTGSFCSEETLRNIPFRGRSLIFSDCEGFEKTLFTEEMAQVLTAHDLLIETHDFLDITISSTIRQRFEKTHEIASIESVDDILKVYTYNYAELSPYSLKERKLLLSERRRSIMQWLYIKSRSTTGGLHIG